MKHHTPASLLERGKARCGSWHSLELPPDTIQLLGYFPSSRWIQVLSNGESHILLEGEVPVEQIRL